MKVDIWIMLENYLVYSTGINKNYFKGLAILLWLIVVSTLRSSYKKCSYYRRRGKRLQIFLSKIKGQ